MGDLAVLGRPLAALISARASGHALNQEFVRRVAKESIHA
jgi:UDP-3-O-acyl-N-acetylglucosamine deacetylase